MVGGPFMIAGGMAGVAVATGAPAGFIAFPGFALWGTWLLVTGMQLLRGRP
jgi:hypothetical protein